MKYEFVGEPDENGFQQIRALRDIPIWDVKKGELGGWVGSPDCLPQEGDAWIDEWSTVDKGSTVSRFSLVARSDIMGSRVVDSVIGVFSIVKNSIVLSGSVVNGSTVDMSLLIDSGMKASVVDRSRARGSWMNDSRVIGSSVRSATLNRVDVGAYDRILTITPATVFDGDLTAIFGPAGTRVCTRTFSGSLYDLEEWARKHDDLEYLRAIPYLRAEEVHRTPEPKPIRARRPAKKHEDLFDYLEENK